MPGIQHRDVLILRVRMEQPRRRVEQLKIIRVPLALIVRSLKAPGGNSAARDEEPGQHRGQGRTTAYPAPYHKPPLLLQKECGTGTLACRFELSTIAKAGATIFSWTQWFDLAQTQRCRSLGMSGVLSRNVLPRPRYYLRIQSGAAKKGDHLGPGNRRPIYIENAGARQPLSGTSRRRCRCSGTTPAPPFSPRAASG